MSRPNLLFVFADQLRASALGHVNPQVLTPRLDAFATQGVQATRHFANTPVCGPNRGTLLTGTYPMTHGVVGNDLAIRTDLPTFGTVGRDHGHHTGYIGKWHLDGVPRDKFTPPGPRRLGFETWAAFNCTHDYFRPRYFTDDPQVVETPGYEPVVQTNMALNFLDDRAEAGEPFCLMLSWGPPHDPYAAVPDEHKQRYDAASITLRPNVEPDTDNPLARRLDCRQTTADYYAAVTALDEQFGRLLDRLAALGLDENTLVVFTSDHGDMLWSHGWMKKQTPYDESIAVPLLMRWPGGLPGGTTCDALIGTVDLLPTIGGLLGWSPSPTFEGRDLSAALLGQAGDRLDEVLIANHIDVDESIVQGMPVWRGLRTARYTYAELADREPWLLFDNDLDPYQQRNLIDEPAHAELQQSLAERLTAWLTQMRDPACDSPSFLRRLGLIDAWAQREAIQNP